MNPYQIDAGLPGILMLPPILKNENKSQNSNDNNIVSGII